jgi:hypothetical protein
VNSRRAAHFEVGSEQRHPLLTHKTVELGGIEIGWDGYKQEIREFGPRQLKGTGGAFTLAKPRLPQ